MQARAQGDSWTWGMHTLHTASSIRYLGVHLHESVSWEAHVQQAAHKGLQVLHKWARVLASLRLPVCHKLRLVNSHLRPVKEYGMEVRGPGDPRTASAVRLLQLAPIENMLQFAVKPAVGVQATAKEGASSSQRGVTHNLLRADVHVLSAEDACGFAHLRYHERTCSVQAAPPLAQDGNLLPAKFAPALLGWAVRSSMAPDNAWRRCVDAMQPRLAAAR